MKEIKLYKSPWKALKLLALTLPFVVIGVWMINREDSSTSDYIIGWVSTCFFGLGIPVSLFHLFDRRPQIVINEVGIFDRTTHKDFINWEIIRDAYLVSFHGQRFISLEVEEDFKPSNAKGYLYKEVARFSEGLGAQELNISLGQVSINEPMLTEFIKEMSQADHKAKGEVLKTLRHKA